MASHYTGNYGLNQWEPEDYFIRTEFNTDNLKVDTELKRVADMAEESHRSLPLISYTVYNLALQAYYEGKLTGRRKAMLFDGFLNGGIIESSTGGVTVQNNALYLSGAGAVGSIKSPSIFIGTTWKKAICWVRHSGGEVFPAISGIEMPMTDIHGSINLQGDSCIEQEFTLLADGTSSVVATLRLECRTFASIKVYDYGIIFL